MNLISVLILSQGPILDINQMHQLFGLSKSVNIAYLEACGETTIRTPCLDGDEIGKYVMNSYLQKRQFQCRWTFPFQINRTIYQFLVLSNITKA